MSLATPANLRRLQRALYVAAKRDPVRRFDILYDQVWREDILAPAYALSRENGGAPGVDGVLFAQIEAYGVDRWLGELREEVRTGCYTPQPVRRVMIPKSGGVGQRPLGIPTIRDRVVQTAAKLVIEPIFEADFDEAAYGYRPRRSAHDAVRAVHQALDDGRTDVVDADLSQYFDTIPHAALMRRLARRISDGRMLHLLKRWLKAPVSEPDGRGAERMRGGKRATRGPRRAEWCRRSGRTSTCIGTSRRFGAPGSTGSMARSSSPMPTIWCALSARGPRGPRADATLDGQHGARAERGQDRRAGRPMRVLRFPGLRLRTDVLAANRWTLQRSTAFEEGHRRCQGGDPEAASEREPGAGGGGSQSPEPHRAGLGGVLLPRIAGEGAARCAASPVPCGAPLSPTTAQAGRAWVSAGPRHGSVRGAGRSGS